MSRICFMDIEASALISGFPVEIGWAWQEGRVIRTESVLIAPADKWLDTLAWDPSAEATHGLTLDSLRMYGSLPADACQCLNSRLHDCGVVFDTGLGGTDMQWLKQAYAQAGDPPTYSFLSVTSENLIKNRLGFARISPPMLQTMHQHAPVPTHRAENDAAHWVWWLIAIDVAGEHLHSIDPNSFANALREVDVPRGRSHFV